ncbi:MAG: lmo0937 family membrane protein [Anaerolineae bacterium]|uniref:lmo0937 family membrane protein n=1 Tax=Chloroflexota TaxID=200795 RepID=UPI001E192981|nr:lmo0937 family membrane protein [Anaerolineae bacterium]MBK9613503.1 lmo0937 family membrane protein [Dehalococcoidia bacterium]
MLTTIIVILIVLWLLGFFGPSLSSSIPRTGNLIHTLLVIAVILVILTLLKVI